MMYATDDESTPSGSGYTTPPLSPTKTISTEGWSSPRTPGSPRKSRSCLFFRHIDHELEEPFFTPPPSPTKSKFAAQLGALSIPEVLSPTCDPTSPDLTDDSPVKRNISLFDRPSPRRSLNVARSTNRSLPASIDNSNTAKPLTVPSLDFSRSPQDRHIHRKQRRSYRSSSDSSIDALVAKYATPPTTPVEIGADIERDTDRFPNEFDSPMKLGRLSTRCASSPLRPSQWASRGGLLSPPRKSQTSTPDRFIHCRRPPAVTRESFELNKPIEREQISQRGHRAGGDPFGRRVRRSDRLNAELRGLREAHTVLAGRSGGGVRSPNLRLRSSSLVTAARQISAGAVWNVGGPSAVSDTVAAVSTGNGGMLGSGTIAPLYTSSFLDRADPEAELEAYERRLALALDVDQTDRILQHSPSQSSRPGATHNNTPPHKPHIWRDSAWAQDGVKPLLDAPQLRDDYYCTLLAYSHTARCLAVGLGNFVHLWSERDGVNTPESLNSIPTNAASNSQHITSLDFSSNQGGHAILAVGRADGRIVLWSPFDSEPRFDATQPKPVSCVSFRPTTVQRPSLRDRAIAVSTEELLIRDEVGHIYFYSVEWPSATQCALFGWHGAMTLLARMTIHTQQICGLAWSAAGDMFASGGNDNNCYLFETKRVLQSETSATISATLNVRAGPAGESIYTVTNRSGPVLHLPHTAAKHKWTLNAAVKAMAFCPWHRGLVAIGGGSNDRCIHFYHTRSGTCLATIDCAAQVTSLVWSQTRREIAATFGFAQPEHPYRIAVFAWPSCEQVVAVPWWDENRALCAVAYPGGPMSTPDDEETDGERARGEDGLWNRRGVEEGCLVVAASDMAVRFHEIWTGGRGGHGSGGLLGGSTGLLGGSDILEELHGVEREGAVIRVQHMRKEWFRS
ncbi:WD40 repeat-like protein [Macroventuria anomochaeta]|uniref:WD40 repeat-like protein n=1 Tax=Macroventuria anomochaeta TaxID=301207 RepID=A0ACB6RQQ3_9PLEO|nr:WD40 repeat-like protein [Macroventuria anomochaeta]KAF2624236.1 WD40 repeat-like protein [Macroventuria anomochaeta]